jgi:small subunit ribosomal protein S6
VPFYEAMYLVHPSVDDERLAEIIARYNQVVESAGGTIERASKWDRRRLAYPINKVQEATYVLMYFQADPQVPKELDRLFRISDEVIRYLIIRHEKPKEVLTASEVPAAVEAVVEDTATVEEEAATAAETAEAEPAPEPSDEEPPASQSHESDSAEEEPA